MISEEPTPSRAAPATSMRCCLRATFSLNLRISHHAASAPSGMLTKKIQRQFRKSTKIPPSAGPTTAEIAQTLAT